MSRRPDSRGEGDGKRPALGMLVHPDIVSAILADPGAGAGAQAPGDLLGPSHGPVPFALLCDRPTIGEAELERNSADIELLWRMLKRALSTHEKGVNILLCGSGSTSREEFPLVLAARIGCEIYKLETPAEKGRATGSQEALQRAVLVAQRALSRIGRPCMLVVVPSPRAFPVVVDDGDCLPPWEMHRPARVRMSAWKRMLENNPVVTLWRYDGPGKGDSGHSRRIDMDFVDRFDHVVEVAEIPPARRTSLVLKHMGGVPVSPEWVGRLSAQDGLTARQVERAVRAARLAGCETASDAEAVMERVLASGFGMAGKKVVPLSRKPVAAAYDLEYLNASVDVVRLVERLAMNPRGRILLHGAPGTGKTCLAKHVAERSGRELVSARASDLLDKFVGETEKRIAALFETARVREAVLLLDEADSFLGDRRRALQHWEVSQVNELLVGMENFDGLFICSTNLVEDLDAASFRRFDLKIRFDPMTRDQALRMLTSMLAEMGVAIRGKKESARLRALLDAAPPLTPGDFAAVRRRVAVTGEKVTPADLVAMLHGETSMREPPRPRAGFC